MLSELCVRRPVFATMLVTSLLVLGLFSFRDLGVDLFPKADPATVNVSLRLPGAAPDEMTSSVIMPMENALSGIAGIDQLRANVNAGGTASITVQFLLGRDLDDAANTVREKVAGAMRNVPPEVLPPVIQKQDPDADPIMSLVISGKSTSLRSLTEIADKQVKRALESVDALPQLIQLGECISGRAQDLSRRDVAGRWGHDHVYLATSRPPLPAVAAVHPVRLESQLAEMLAAAWVGPGVVSVYGIAQEGVLPVEVGVPLG